MPVRRGCRDTQTATRLGHRERLNAALAEKFDGGLDQRRTQIPVMIAIAGRSLLLVTGHFLVTGHCGRVLRGGHRGEGNGTMRRMNASQPRSPSRCRATGARRAWGPTLYRAFGRRAVTAVRITLATSSAVSTPRAPSRWARTIIFSTFAW